MKIGKIIFAGLIIATLVFIGSHQAVNAQKLNRGKENRAERTATKSAKDIFKNKGTKLIDAKVTAVSGNTLTVSKDGVNYTVNTDANTRFLRRFWGKSSVSEISAGDNVNVWGKWADDTKTAINATMIRDLSIMKRYGVFMGSIKSKDTASFILTTVNRGDQTVYFDTNTKFVGRDQTALDYSKINAGERVRVKGLWDKTLAKITEVKEVKDFSQPAKATPATAK